MFLSGYRLMWMMVLFDLPVVERKDRKAASMFRKFLLEEGFHMSQFSVYYKLLSGKEVVEAKIKKIKKVLPKKGRIDILSITDKQYENIVSFIGHTEQKTDKKGQLYLSF